MQTGKSQINQFNGRKFKLMNHRLTNSMEENLRDKKMLNFPKKKSSDQLP